MKGARKPEAALSAVVDTTATRIGGRVTIRDVAAAANVSPMTVSNVINRKFQYVSKGTQEIVEREIDRLGYRVQKTGRSLKSSLHRAIGMVIVDDSPSFLVDHFTAHVVAGLSNALSRAGFSLNIQGVPRANFHEATFLRTFDVDGICALLSGPKPERRRMIEALLKLRQPIIAFQEPIRRKSPDLCVVRQDDRGGGRMIARHLHERGARRILFLTTTEEWPALVAREAGIRAELDGSAEIEVIRCEREDFESAQAAIQGYLACHDLPDTVIGGNDRLALAAMTLLQARGVAVPGDVRVSGFNAFEPRKYASPLLTTVESPAYEMGERAGGIILARVSGKPYAAHEVVFPVHVAPGSST